MKNLAPQKLEQITDVARYCKRSLLAVALVSLFVNVLMLTPMFYMMNVFDKAVMTGSVPTLISLASIALFMYGFMAALDWTRAVIMGHVAARFERLVAPRLYDICFDAGSGAVDARGVGHQPLADLNGLRQFVGSHTVMVFFDLPWIPLFLLLMVFFHPVLAVVSLTCMGIMTVIAITNQKLTTASINDTAAASRRSSVQVNSHIRNAEVAAAMGMVGPLKSQWQRQQEEIRVAQLESSNITDAFSSVTRTLNMVMQSAAITTGALLVMTQAISPGVMIAAAMLLGKSIAPIQSAVAGWRAIVIAYEQYKRLSELIVQFPPKPEKMDLPEISGVISVCGLSAQPPGEEKLVLRNINLEIPAGSANMILGASGSGKSSLVRVMLGLWPAYQGTSKIDGAHAHEFDRSSIGPQIGYLPQAIELFDGGIAQNIARFGDINPDLVVQAAKDAGIHDLILSFKEGYDTYVTHTSGLLSPGQQQRIALARALYGRPKLLVLDEPNSNLDDLGEQALNSAIELMKRLGSTVIVVSHRQSSLHLADYVIVMDGGSIKVHGTRDQVIALSNKHRVSQVQEANKVVNKEPVAIADRTSA